MTFSIRPDSSIASAAARRSPRPRAHHDFARVRVDDVLDHDASEHPVLERLDDLFPSFRAPTSIPLTVPQSSMFTITSCATSTSRRVR